MLYLSHILNSAMNKRAARAIKIVRGTAIGLTLLWVLCSPFIGSLESEGLLIIMQLSLILSTLATFVYGLTSASAAAWTFRWCMVLYVVGLISKYLQWPGASGILVMAFGIPFLLFLSGTIALPFRVKHNTFLILTGTLCGLVLAAGYWASLCKMMHWPGADLIFGFFVPAYLLVTILVLVGIQLTDFVKWDPAHRRFLTNNILLPWAFVFIVGGTLHLFPKQYFHLMNSGRDWGMVEYAL